jgi:thiol-disulfide isomerase/thioredoxin
MAEPEMGESAPPLTIKTLDGREFDLKALRGKVVLVNFWATWCGPCLAEMPMLEKYYRRFQEKGLELIALSIDEPGNREKVRRVMSRFHFPGAMVGDASRNGFGVPDGVPVTYVIDAQGMIRDQILMAEEDILDEVLPPLLNEANVKPVSTVKR